MCSTHAPHFLSWRNPPKKIVATGISAITDIKITVCPEDNCVIPGYRKVSQDLNKYSRGSFVHLHFTDKRVLDDYNDDSSNSTILKPITNIAVLQGQDAEMGPEWERIDGNLNHGSLGPVLTMFVQRNPDESPIDSIVVKYGYDSHAAIGYDRLPQDLNVGTGRVAFDLRVISWLAVRNRTVYTIAGYPQGRFCR